MNNLADPESLLGMLQRGRGKGYLAALEADSGIPAPYIKPAARSSFCRPILVSPKSSVIGINPMP